MFRTDIEREEAEDIEMLEDEDKEEDLGRENRPRKDVTYQEPLSEKDLHKVLNIHTSFDPLSFVLNPEPIRV